ncbi:thiolase family protein [Streptosporangium sp. G11]|uniref:thiolase family protein n=1 Tax=Streptosporangium sp. G11 TaxID=3436926 RepID=UPI003EBDB3D0
MRNKVAIVGAGMTPFGEHFDRGLEQLAADSYRTALASVDKGIDPADIEAGFFANVMGSLGGNEIPSGATLANAIGLPGLPVSRIENGCPSGSDSIRIGAMAVASGVHDVIVVVGAEKLRERSTKESLLESGRVGHPILSYANTAATIFAPQAARHMHEYGTTREQLAMVAVKAWDNASLNPNAQRQESITVDDVLNSPMLCSPFTVLDSCPQSDGAAAVVLCRADIAHRFTDSPVYIAGVGLATEGLYYHEKTRMTGWDCTRLASSRAYEMAGIAAQDLDAVELHDCFTGTEIMTYEDLGLCEEGAGGKLVEYGETTLHGRIPVNPSGGLLAKGHPVGATGVAQVVELFGQLREQAGARQVSLRNGKALQHNVGGYSVGISVVTVLSRD